VGLKKLLFICSKNRWRSPTAEAIFSEYQQIEADSAGLDSDAEVCVSGEALQWADIIFVMEQSHRSRLAKRFRPWLKGKRLICLDIPDNYRYMDPDLVKILKQRVLPLL
jgi:predicted protein tyrosine phosphatase